MIDATLFCFERACGVVWVCVMQGGHGESLVPQYPRGSVSLFSISLCVVWLGAVLLTCRPLSIELRFHTLQISGGKSYFLAAYWGTDLGSGASWAPAASWKVMRSARRQGRRDTRAPPGVSRGLRFRFLGLCWRDVP
jgi:hypothetical protein